jgi:tetratricopeptide (TPR) repeat protein
LLALSAALAGAAGNYDRAERVFEEALDIVRPHGEHRVLGMTLYLRAYNYGLYQEHARLVDVGRESMEHLRRTSDLWTLASASGQVGSALAWLGHFEEAASTAEEGKTLGRKLGNWPAYYAADRARSYRLLGRDPDIGRLEQDGRRDYELGQRLGIQWLTSTGQGRIGLAAFWAGRWDEALECYEAAARLEMPGAGGGQAARVYLCHAYMGNRRQALELIEPGRRTFAQPRQPNTATAWLSALMAIETLALLGEHEAAAGLYPVARELMAKGTVLRGWDFRLLQTVAGIAATCARDWPSAEHHFREALRLARHLPMRLESPEARRFYATMLLQREEPDDIGEATRQLEQAMAEYVQIGMPAHEALTRDMLASIRSSSA